MSTFFPAFLMGENSIFAQNELPSYGSASNSVQSAAPGYESPGNSGGTSNELASYGKGGSGGNGGGFFEDSAFSDEDMNLKMLMASVPGVPGDDYPIFTDIPVTGFECRDKIFGGK